MSLLERVIIAQRCRSTHHYIAMDALPLLTGPDAEKWRNLILVHNDELLKGAKAPDAVFKDFKNHVLHVGDGEWGGARDAAMAWYAEAVGHLQDKKWAKAVYALGVLSHYYADPIQPFHTGQTEEEGAMHRAVEWSIAKSRTVIKERIEEIGYPSVEAGEGIGFVSDMVLAGAEKSHPHYQTILDHYNLDVGAKNPAAGLDQTLIDIISELVAYATAGLSVLFSRAFAEAGVAAPNTHITVPGYLATLDIPIHWVSKKLDNAADKRTVTAMYKEYRKTGKVIKKLPDDDKQIRKMHARQVTRRPLKELDAQPLKPIGQSYEPRPEHVEFAKKIADSLAPVITEEIEEVSSGDVAKAKGRETPVEDVAVIEETSNKKTKRTSKKKMKPKVRIAAAVSEGVTEAAETAQASKEEDKARIEKEAAEQAEKDRLEAEEAKAAEEADRIAAEKLAKIEAEDAERVEKERFEAEELARLEAEEEQAAQERLEADELARMEAEEADRVAAQEEAKLEAQEALRLASEERARQAEEEKARLEEEELTRIEAEEAELEAQETKRFEAREAAEFARLEAEEAAELARMEIEEQERLAAEEEDAAQGDEEEFSLEELAAFDTNLTDNGSAPAEPQTAPPMESFFENSDDGERSRSRLMPEDQVIDAPSIGKKTARRLNRVGVFTVDDLLNCNSEEIAFELDVRHIDEPTLEDWKAQARLMIEVPGLRIHDAQILVGAGVRSGEDLANTSATRIFHASMGFLKSSEGARVVRDDHVLHETEVDEWIGLAKERDVA